ncbi:MAG: methionyl-tRNA formyltransferase [Minisyncoccia bacterium]
MKSNGKIIFFGTSEFAVPALEAFFNAGYEIGAVITTPDEPVGRKQILTPSPVKFCAEKLGLKILQPQKLDSEFLKILQTTNHKLPTTLGIVASYGKIIPKEIIDSFPLGILNIHPSLLPKYRGPSPIQTQILNGETEIGVTIIKIDELVDHGPIVAEQESRIMNHELFEDAQNKLSRIGTNLLVKILPDYISGKIKPIEQNHDLASFTKKTSKEDGKIDWNKPAEQIYDQFRAFHKWPGVWTIWKNKILKITDLRVQNGKIEILRLQLEGGKEMSLKEFVAGHKDFIVGKLGR